MVMIISMINDVCRSTPERRSGFIGIDLAVMMYAVDQSTKSHICDAAQQELISYGICTYRTGCQTPCFAKL